jgi:hypothetical protein
LGQWLYFSLLLSASHRITLKRLEPEGHRFCPLFNCRKGIHPYLKKFLGATIATLSLKVGSAFYNFMLLLLNL